ncbi:hypothetical protein EGM51_17785 [Verrucomicrobia bacterium S94]|nr:hypothetical protein EGM51_17785 [Verrucomicrobia bacterium S94]
MQKSVCLIAGLLVVGHVVFAEAKEVDSFSKPVIKITMEKVADWQYTHEFDGRNLAKKGDQRYLHWIYGPYVNGLVAAGRATDDRVFTRLAESIGKRAGWGALQWGWVANHHATLQSWIELYEQDPDPVKIAETVKSLDFYIEKNAGADDDMRFVKKNEYKWSWCDALYMSPPAFARLAKVTGDDKYLEFLHKWWWIASDFYYSPEHQLYFRDQSFFTKKAPNGQPVFWCRGNGWVIGGLVRVLQYLEANDPMRPKYEAQLKAMLGKLKEIQCNDGLWHGSLLDPMSPDQPDTSGSGFILYGFAYAVNEGLISKAEYMPVIEKAWPALLSHVSPEGEFIGVQPVGDSPRGFDPDYSIPYGTGAFLLAAGEVYKMER